jgi:hypothetical protein
LTLTKTKEKMTETLTIDTTTGLPELPEGMFWRVGNSKEWDDYGRERSYPAVMLMEKRDPVVKKTEVPVYGVNWLGMKTQTGTEWVETLEEQEPLEVTATFFNNRFAPIEGKIPTIAINRRKKLDPYSDRETWTYDIPFTEEGVAHNAKAIWDHQLLLKRNREEYERQQAEKKATEDRLFGDYPPKTLVRN